MTHTVSDCFSYLQDIVTVGYGKRLPGVCDEVFSELADHYASADAGEREKIRDNVSISLRPLLIGFSDRFAMLSERCRDEGLLRKGFLAHSIEGFRYDERENLLRLALLSHVSKRLGVDPRETIEWAASLSSPHGATAFKNFSTRPARMNSLKAMRIVEKDSPDGVVYEYSW